MLLANQAIGLSLVVASISLWVLKAKGVLRLSSLGSLVRGFAAIFRRVGS